MRFHVWLFGCVALLASGFALSTESDLVERALANMDAVSIDESFELVDESNFTVVTILSPKAEEEEEVEEEEEGEEGETEAVEGEVEPDSTE